MHRSLRLLAVSLCAISLGMAQLTNEQKTADMSQLAALYAKRYAPYQWKQQAFGYDLLNLKPWLQKAAATTSDLDFYDVLIEYVASLHQGSHDVFSMPSTFSAWTHFDVDIYDGRPLIEFIDRQYLPKAKFPFEVGDELLSVDGKTAGQLLKDFAKYWVAPNPKAAVRSTAQGLTFRIQAYMPHAQEIGDNASIEVLRANGNIEKYDVPWDKQGTPILFTGPVPSPSTSSARKLAKRDDVQLDDPATPDYMKPLLDLQNASAVVPDHSVNYLGKFPAFNPPDNFKLRLGSKTSDLFISGTFPAGGYTIGYIRIPDFGGSNAAFNQFANEMIYFQKNTDGLIVDEMGNPGGNACYAQALASAVVPYAFEGPGFEIRANLTYLNSFASVLQSAKNAKADQWIIDLYTAYLAELKQAYSENRGLTGRLPICGPSFTITPLTDQNGNSIAYAKPVMLVVDEFSTSAADSFAAMFQDSGRGQIFGWRTNGAGGTVLNYSSATDWSEGNTRVTQSLMIRDKPIASAGLPTAPLIENIGVQVDIPVDYMTKDNLLSGGTAFVRAMSDAMVNIIQTSK